MARAKDTNARLTRWFLALQDFHFTVCHRAGTANADGLSRIWAAFAGLSGFTPTPISPLSRGTRTSPWKRRRNTCTQSSRADRSQLKQLRRWLQKPPRSTHWWAMSPEDIPDSCVPLSSQRAVCDRPARRLSTGPQSTASRAQGHDCTFPHLNKYLLRGPYCIRYYIYIYIYIYICSASRKTSYPFIFVTFLLCCVIMLNCFKWLFPHINLHSTHHNDKAKPDLAQLSNFIKKKHWKNYINILDYINKI